MSAPLIIFNLFIFLSLNDLETVQRTGNKLQLQGLKGALHSALIFITPQPFEFHISHDSVRYFGRLCMTIKKVKAY